MQFVNIYKDSADGPLAQDELGSQEMLAINTSRGWRHRETKLVQYARFGTRVLSRENQNVRFGPGRPGGSGWHCLHRCSFSHPRVGSPVERQRRTASGGLNDEIALFGAIHTGVGCLAGLVISGACSFTYEFA